MRSDGEILVAVEVVEDLLDEAGRRGVRLLGLEGFLIDSPAISPALSRIVDFSLVAASSADQRARSLLRGAWATPPTPEDQMSAAASGRYMIAVVLDE